MAVSASPNTAKQAFLEGVRTCLPLTLGVVPFGMVTGVTAMAVGLSAAQSLAMSFVVFAGSSQLAATQLIGEGAPAAVILLTTFIVNLRFLMYSATIAGHFRGLSFSWRALIAYLMTDQSFAFGITRYSAEPDMPHKGLYYLGTAIPIWFVWVASTALGVFVGARVPPEWGLEFVIPLMFLALLVPAVKDKPTLFAALVGGAVAVLGRGLPYNLGLITAAVLGISAGLFAESFSKRQA